MPGKFDLRVTLVVSAFVAAALAGTATAQTTIEEITVNFEIPRLTAKDIFVHYDGSTVYLPFTEVFRILDLNVGTDPDRTRIEGFFVTKDRRYELRPKEARAVVGGMEIPLPPGSFQYDGMELYLRIDQFKRLFDLDMAFSFSMLRVLLPLNDQFPAYQRLKRKQAREKLEKTEAALRNVKIIPRKHEWFSGGVVDWTLSANPIGGSGQYADMGIGSMLLGGDLSVSGAGNTTTGIRTDEITARWHYAINPNPYVTQVELGSINSGGMLSRSMRGALFTNRPQVQQAYFQTINLTGTLEPGWEVELYADGKLIDYAESDQSGEYHFNVDINYGSSDLQLKMFGPNGEIRTEQEHVQVPYTLVRKGQFEYTSSVGSDVVTPGRRWYTQANAYYGVFNRITAGLGADIPLSPQIQNISEKPLLSAEATAKILSSAVANVSCSPGYRSLFGLNYTMPSSISANLGLTTFSENKLRNPVEQKYSASLSLSSPIRIGRRYLGLRYNVSRDVYKTFSSTSMNYGFTASVWRLYVNYLGRMKSTRYPSRVARTLTSQMLLSSDLMRWLRPQFRIDYDHTTNGLSRFGVYVTRRFLKTGQISLSYERSPVAKSDMIMFGVNFFTAAASFATRAQYSDHRMAMSQVQHGSIRYDRSVGKLRFDRRNGIGYGSAVVRPFIDADNDGIAGKNEEVLPGLRARIRGVGGRPIGRGRMFYYDGLRPYDSYTIQVDATTLDNPLLKPAYEHFTVSVNPNVVTVVDVPVVMAADISGTVERETTAGKVGVGGMLLHVLNLSKDMISEITTFSSGQYYYLGLVPGTYRAYLDSAQMERYGYVSEPPSIEFEVKPSATGSSVENISFVLKAKQ